jgi:hypothetical protein
MGSLSAIIFAFCASVVPNKKEEMMLNCFDQMVNCTMKVGQKTTDKVVEQCKAQTKKKDLTKHWDDQ